MTSKDVTLPPQRLNNGKTNPMAATRHDHKDYEVAAEAEAEDSVMSSDHTGDEGHAGQGDRAEMFRRRLWWSLLLTIPVVATSHMVMDWFGYELDFTGIEWVGPVLGTVLFFWAR